MNEEKDPKRFYVYILYRATGVPFYVGYGQGERLLDHERRSYRGKTHKDKVVQKMQRVGEPVGKMKYAEGLTLEEAIAFEIELIAAIGRHPNGVLANGTDGGEGTSGILPEIRKQAGLKLRGCKNFLGRKHTPESIQKMREIKTGLRHTEETRKKISSAKRGTKLREETKKKISEAHKGMKFTDEHRANMSRAKMKENLSEETLAKRSAGLKGQKRTPESRQKMRESRLAYLAKQKGVQNA